LMTSAGVLVWSRDSRDTELTISPTRIVYHFSRSDLKALFTGIRAQSSVLPQPGANVMILINFRRKNSDFDSKYS
jgi:hypothetical protein